MIKVRSSTKLSVEVTNERNTIKADVTEKSGGDDSGLSPHELLEASLGSCTNITVMMYARMKNIPLMDIHTKVEILKEGDENLISREIEFIGELDASQKDKLLIIANKCPMHKFLSHKSVIETKLI